MTDSWDRLVGSPVAVLGTVGPDGRPHQVPITFAVIGERLVTMIDWKPKTGRRLQRLANIEAEPKVSLLVHRYDDDWSLLWWVRVDGEARLFSEGAEWKTAQAALVAKYPQYAATPPTGEAIVISPTRVSAWSA